MILNSQPLSEFVLIRAQGIRTDLCPGYSSLIHSQASSEFVSIRANSWLIYSQCPETPKLPIPPTLPHIALFSGILLADALLLCVLCELCGCNSIMQNKANVKMGNINISTVTTKCYVNKQRTMNNERHSKQTQSNPIPPTQYAIRNTQYEEQTQSKPILPPRSAIRPTWRRAVIRCIMIPASLS